MKASAYPLPLDAALAREVAKAAKASGLSRAELMRQAIAFGHPKVAKEFRKSPPRITAVNPLPPKQARALYQQEDDDVLEIGQLMAAQRFEAAD